MVSKLVKFLVCYSKLYRFCRSVQII